jgi:energy-coupling factor transporter ATP-binding protein EcfA2
MQDVAISRLERIAARLGSLSLDLAGDEVESLRIEMRRLAGEYLAPRLTAPRGPLVVAVVGPGGSGKSTLVNSLAGRAVSPAGALRPTTGAPVVWTGDVVPGTLDGVLARHDGRVVDVGPPPPNGLVIVDTPPPGDPAARDVLAAADACVFVATALRYADAVGWDLIASAARRRMPMVFALNRLGGAPEAQQAVIMDFAGRLADNGLVARSAGESVVGIAEGPVGDDGLPAEWITGLRKELESMGEPEQGAATIRAMTGSGMVRLEHGLDAIRTALIDAAVVRNELLDPARSVYAAESDDLAAAVASGALGDVIGSRDALAADLAALVTHRTGRAARAAASRWEGHPVGERLLAANPGLWSHGAVAVADARERFIAWRSGLEAATAPGAGRWRRRTRMRKMAAMLAAAALDPVRRPSGRLGRRLESVPGAIAAARSDLVAAMREVLEIDAGRFLAAVGSGPPAGVLEALALEGVPS